MEAGFIHHMDIKHTLEVIVLAIPCVPFLTRQMCLVSVSHIQAAKKAKN